MNQQDAVQYNCIYNPITALQVQYSTNVYTTQLLHLFVISTMAKITNKCSNWVCIVYIKEIYHNGKEYRDSTIIH